MSKILGTNLPRKILVGEVLVTEQDYQAMASMACEAGCKVVDVCAAIAIVHTPEVLLAKETGMSVAQAAGLITSIKSAAYHQQRAAAPNSSPKPPAPTTADKCPGCGRTWSKGRGGKLCGICVADHDGRAREKKVAPTPTPRSKDSPPVPLLERAKSAMERGAEWMARTRPARTRNLS